MGNKTGIDYVDATWNPWQGCHPVSEGCDHCYMYREKRRFRQDPAKVVRSSKRTFNAPLWWKEPRRIFVCSWSDFWIAEADQWRQEAFNIMMQAPQHEYVIITKRPDRMVYWLAGHKSSAKGPLPNIVWGITAENQNQLVKRIHFLLHMFDRGKLILSVEPMLGPVDAVKYMEFGLSGPPWIDGIICGCESGPQARPMQSNWACDLRKQCRDTDTPFFMKQMMVNGKLTKDINLFPEDLRVREWPSWQD